MSKSKRIINGVEIQDASDVGQGRDEPKDHSVSIKRRVYTASESESVVSIVIVASQSMKEDEIVRESHCSVHHPNTASRISRCVSGMP